MPRLAATWLVLLLAISPLAVALQSEGSASSTLPQDQMIVDMLDTESIVRSRLARRVLVAQGEAARLALTAGWPDDTRWWARWEVLDALHEIGSPASAPLFVQALSDPAYGVRTVAVRALDRIGSPLLWDHASVLADDAAWPVRRALAITCGRQSSPSTAGVLARLALDEDEEVRRAAFRSLDRRRDPAASDVIRELLQRDDCREAIFEWVSPAGRPELAAAFARALPLVEGSAAAITASAMLTRCLAEPPYTDFEEAAIRDRLLVGLAESELVQSRTAAAALRRWRVGGLAPRLRSLLDETSDPAAHRQIWDLLIDLEGSRLQPFLRARLSEGIANRPLAIRALGRVAGEGSLPFFESLWDDEADPATHQAVLSAIEGFPASETLPLLERALDAPSFRTRHQAAALLVASKEPDCVDRLLEHIDSEPHRQQTQYLRLVTSWSHPAIEEWLLDLAESGESLSLRRAAIEALGTYEPPTGAQQIVDGLRALLADLEAASKGPAEDRAADQRTRVILVRSLANRLGAGSAELLNRMRERGAAEGDDELLRAVIGSSGPLSLADRRELLQEILSDPRLEGNRLLLRDAARRLARAGDPLAGELMRRHFASADPDERVLILPELADFDSIELETDVLEELEKAVDAPELDYVLLQSLIEYCLAKRSPRLLPPLLHLAERSSAPLALRAGALEAVGDIGPAEGSEAALLALARRELEAARSPAKEGWSEEREILLRRVFDALGRVGSDRCVPLLADCLLLDSMLELEEETWSYYQEPDRSLPDSRFAWEATIVRALSRRSPERVEQELLRALRDLRQSGQLCQINDDKLGFIGQALLSTGRSGPSELGAELLETCFRVSPNPSPADFEARYWLARQAWSRRDYAAVSAHLEAAIDALWAGVLSPSEARVRLDQRVSLLSPRETLEAWRQMARVLEHPEGSTDTFAQFLREVVAPDAELLIDLAGSLLSQEGPRSLVDLTLGLASEVDPGRSDLARLRARRAADDGAWDAAAHELALAADLAARDGLCPLATLHLERARCLLQAGRPGEARESLLMAIAQDAELGGVARSDPRLAPLLEEAGSRSGGDGKR